MADGNSTSTDIAQLIANIDARLDPDNVYENDPLRLLKELARNDYDSAEALVASSFIGLMVISAMGLVRFYKHAVWDHAPHW